MSVCFYFKLECIEINFIALFFFVFDFAKIFLFVSLSLSSFFCTGVDFAIGPYVVESACK
jgi:hypothetical protein